MSPNIPSLCSCSSSQESFGSNYASAGKSSRASSPELDKNQGIAITGNSKLQSSINNNFANVLSSVKINLLPQLNTIDNQTSKDEITITLSSSSEEVIDLTTEENIHQCDNLNDWESTPELDL